MVSFLPQIHFNCLRRLLLADITSFVLLNLLFQIVKFTGAKKGSQCNSQPITELFQGNDSRIFTAAVDNIFQCGRRYG